ncbi:MAG: hypothetical protein HY848_00530 [Betaproteobacteria bacterium]|nr:hypothetical protein [Betaproteobacteria bacterium]
MRNTLRYSARANILLGALIYSEIGTLPGSSHPPLAPALQEGGKTANIHARLGVIRETPHKWSRT